MLVWKHGRGLLAGMGVTGSLLAAVIAGFALTGGVLGFNSWPSAGPATADRALRVASPSPRTERAAPLALPSAGRPAPATGPLLTTGGGVRPSASIERRRSTTRVPQPATSTAPVSPGAAAAQPAPATPVQPAAARLVADTTRGAAGAVRGATQAVAPIPAAGPALAGAGAQAATTVEAVGETAAGALDAP